jgi:hypothetical protein
LGDFCIDVGTLASRMASRKPGEAACRASHSGGETKCLAEDAS